ncbi:MAG: hypothetical protein ACJAVA_002547, partial [Flavobacteriaceae bacterium]
MNKPIKCISVQEARTLQDNWVNSRGTSIQNLRNEEDSREVVYSVAELEEFLAYVKSQSLKKGIANPGVRIYFASYNDAKSTRATVFLSATDSGDADSNNDYDISPFNKAGNGWPP